MATPASNIVGSHDARFAAPPPRIAAIQAVLFAADAEQDYGRAKLSFDKLVDPTIDIEAGVSELDDLVDRARQLAGPSASEGRRLDALRTLIYRPGPWNEGRPFAYDHANFKDIRLKLLPHYLETRLGNCVSMPILFLILGEKLGLDLSLAVAPAHFFLHHRGRGRTVTNLETTSGADPARDFGFARRGMCPHAASPAASICGRCRAAKA